MTRDTNLQQAIVPLIEPLTLTESKNYLKISGSDDDILIANLIATVRQAAESFLKVSLITQSWLISYDEYTPLRVRLLMGPVQSVTSVTALTRDGTATIINSNTYSLGAGKQTITFDAHIMSHVVEILYVTGYGDTANDIPNPIKQGMLAHIAAIYDGRAGANYIPMQTRSLYAPYKMLAL